MYVQHEVHIKQFWPHLIFCCILIFFKKLFACVDDCLCHLHCVMYEYVLDILQWF